MVGRFDDVKKGDLCGTQEGVQTSLPAMRVRVEEPAAQESERP